MSFAWTTALTGTEDNKPTELGDYTLSLVRICGSSHPPPLTTAHHWHSTAWDVSGTKTDIKLTSRPCPRTALTATRHLAMQSARTGTALTIRILQAFGFTSAAFIDTRTQDERRYALLFDPLAAKRLPQRDYILRAMTTAPSAMPAPSMWLCCGLVRPPSSISGATPDKMQVELKQINPDQAFRANSPYRPGDSLVHSNKHYICNRNVTSGAAITQHSWRRQLH